MSEQATLTEIKEFFEMTAEEMMKEYRELSYKEQKFFKIEVSKVINN